MTLEQQFEALRAQLRRSPPKGIGPAQLDAWLAANRPRLLGKLAERAAGRVYRVGREWYVDAGLLAALPKVADVQPTATGWHVHLDHTPIPCERIGSRLALPGQRGSLYRCTRAHAEHLAAACTRTGARILTVEQDTWPEDQGHAHAPTPAKSGCGCGHTCGCGPCRRKYHGEEVAG